jgi:3-deoxy-7-phosphoheptulonate synthase
MMAMIAVMKKDHDAADIQAVSAAAREEELDVKISSVGDRTAVAVIGICSDALKQRLGGLPGVERLAGMLRPYALVTRDFQPSGTVVDLGGGCRVGEGFAVIAGPCAVESREMIDEVAAFLSSHGIRLIRGGAFKARTSPYGFQGLGEKGLDYLRRAADRHGLKVVTEVLGTEDVPATADRADILQVGARNAQNYRLLALLGGGSKPVLLKRGFMMTIDELLQSAEYIMVRGNGSVILCERGIRTFETATRNTLDISAVPVLKEISHLPFIVDPSHASGWRGWVPALSCAALAAGADGIMVEVHPDPEKALSDGPQSLDFGQFEAMLSTLRAIETAVRAQRSPQR